MISRLPVPVLALLALVQGCAPGGVARELRADEPTATTAMGGRCTEPGEPSEPWTFDFPSTKRGELASAMRKGLVLVSYDCDSLDIIKGCEAAGSYEFASYPAEFEVLDLRDGDSVRASLTGGQALAATLKAEFERGTSLLIAHGEAGMSSTTVWEMPRNRLRGTDKACQRATHFVEVVHFGAFAMKTSTSAEIGSALELFDQGVSAGSESSALRNKVSGSPEACKAGPGDSAPRDCDYVVRLRLVPISAEASDDDPPVAAPPEFPRPAACGAGTVREGNLCVPVARATSHVCKLGDFNDCRDECLKGDGESCANLGYMYEKGLGVMARASAARIHYEKACDKASSNGCTGLAYMFSKGEAGLTKDVEKARTMFTLECRRRNGRACSGLGQLERFAGKADQAANWFRMACNFGYVRGCFYEGQVLSSNSGDMDRARKSFVRACDGHEYRGCLAAAPLLTEGVGGPREPQEGIKMRISAVARLNSSCIARNGEACKILGDFYLGKYGGPAQKDRARDFYGKACGLAIDAACAEQKKLGPPGPPPPPPAGPPRPPGPPPAPKSPPPAPKGPPPTPR